MAKRISAMIADVAFAHANGNRRHTGGAVDELVAAEIMVFELAFVKGTGHMLHIRPQYL